MTSPLTNIAVYNKHVQEYINRFMELDLYGDSFEYLLQRLPQNGHVLELGCGPGNVIKYLQSRRPDLNFFGIDLAPAMIHAAKLQNTNARFEVMDIRAAGQISERFDAVIAAFCIPYLSPVDLDPLFFDLQNLTTKSGIVYLSCMEGERERSGLEKTSFTGDDKLFINYYPRREIETLLKNYGFQIQKFSTIDYPETDGSFTTDLIYLAEKEPCSTTTQSPSL
jgi:cyclopropane fatty-acyl-phospholipid synthase-like methyltransferase